MEHKDIKSEYVILRHLLMPDKGKCFFSTNGSEDPRLSYKGDVWYEIIGYTDSVSDAQTMCYDNYGGCPTTREFEEYFKELYKKRDNELRDKSNTDS